MSNPTYDLSALAERLLGEQRLRHLARGIQDAQRLGSLHADLVMALESLDALDALLSSPSSDKFGPAITESALLNNAILLYARATKTTSQKRKTFDLKSRFTPEQLIAHQELVDLRDDAIAHFGSGGSYTGLWQTEVVILQVTDRGSRPAFATRRQTRDRKLIARARNQIETARALMRNLSEERLDVVTAELNKLAGEDLGLIQSEIDQHPLNLGVMMTSGEVAEVVAKGARGGGYMKGIVRHRGG